MNITINQITNQQETVLSTVLTKILTVKRNGGEYGWDANNIPYCFVPDASLSAYQSSSAWSSLNLHGTSEFNSLVTQNGWDLPTT